MPSELTYDYAVIRVVPRVERGEQMNVGVILSCVDADFLESRIEIDEARLRALDPTLDLDAVRAGLAMIPVVCAGGAAAGELGDLSQRGRFRWPPMTEGTVRLSAAQMAALLEGLEWSKLQPHAVPRPQVAC